MGFFRRSQEKRAESSETPIDDPLLRALLGGTGTSRETALQIPTVSSAISLISEIVAGTPVKLYRELDGKTEEVKKDPRIRLLNDDTGDTLNASEFWRAMIRDYFLGKGGYAYIHKELAEFRGIHYVDERSVSIQMGTDPIFKDYDILVQGTPYKPFEFLKLLRNTRDGAQGVGITEENSKILEVAYGTLLFESALVKKGGNKKGFLKSEKPLTEAAISALKNAFRSLYSNSTENVVVLNNGLDFKESSNTSVEMQLNENKETNSKELGRIFHVSPGVISGNATEQEISSLARLAAIPLMRIIECALNRDLLLDSEKEVYYWAFDTKELLKGGLRERYEAYKAGIESNVLQIDEARYMEDLPSLGLNWIKLGLDTVLYDTKTGEVYTPNTNALENLKKPKPKEDDTP